jgi:hypothetical protein
MNYVKKGFEFIAISFEFKSLNGAIMLVYWEILYKKCNGWIRIVIGDNRGQIRVIAIESDTETLIWWHRFRIDDNKEHVGMITFEKDCNNGPIVYVFLIYIAKCTYSICIGV